VVVRQEEGAQVAVAVVVELPLHPRRTGRSLPPYPVEGAGAPELKGNEGGVAGPRLLLPAAVEVVVVLVVARRGRRGPLGLCSLMLILIGGVGIR
jgi:hypothetical protein